MAAKTDTRDNELRVTSVPQELLDKTFYDENGSPITFKIEEWKKFLGLKTSKRIVLVKSGEALEKSISSLAEFATDKAVRRWYDNEAHPAISALANEAEPFLSKCLQDGERTFRKEFITKLGDQSEKIWECFFMEQFAKIGELWSQIKASEEASGIKHVFEGAPYHPAIRFCWQLETKTRRHSLYCLEFPPQKRTVSIFGNIKKLPFPWMYFFLRFKGDDMIFSSVFYRQKRAGGIKDFLCFTNLPNTKKSSPYILCLGDNKPLIKLNDEKWVEKFTQYFWISKFSNELTFYYNRACENFDPVASIDKWGNQTLETITAIPWIATESTIEEYAKQAMTSGGFDDGERSVSPDKDQWKLKVKEILRQYREALEEKLNFLGARFSVSSDSKAAALEAVKLRFKKVFNEISFRIGESCVNAGKETAQRYKELYEQNNRRKEEQGVSDLDS